MTFTLRTLFALVFALLLAASPARTETPGTITKVQKKPKKREYTLITDRDVHIKVVFCRADVFRILAAPQGVFADPKNDPEKAQIVIDTISRAGEVVVEETETELTFRTEALSLRVDKPSCRFALADADNQSIWEEIEPLNLSSNTTVQTLSTDADEFFYGGGQQNGYFSHKGRKIDIRADGNWNEGGHPNPAPFYLSNRGYGVLRHTFAKGSYDFSSDSAIRLEHEEERFDAYYFVGATIPRIVDLYTQFTGRPNLVTIWALELGEADAFMTRDKETKELKKDEEGHYVEITEDCIDRVAEQYRKHDMPGGWILVNDGYGCGYTNLPYVVKSLASLGFYTGLWTEGELVKTQWEVGTAGTRVQKLDVAWTGPAYQFALDANRQAWSSLTSNSDTRGLVWTVQGWAGTHRYAVCWTGDQYGSWDLIRYHIPTLIGSGLSGQAYATTDVDGIFGGSPETYCRDLQWKCFTPVMYAMNGWSHMNKSPWSYEEPYRSINRDYLKLKMRLTPYMYTTAREAWDTGAPIVRGMLWAYPEDRKTWDDSTQHQYLLGDSLLVAPVYTSMKINRGWRKEDIYLPEGRWIDYWDGRRLDGPTTIDAYPITLEKLPLLVKAGAILPMYPEMLYNNQKPKDPLTLDLYPHGESTFELYEDDGLTRKYQLGESARQSIQMTAPEGRPGDIQVRIDPSVGHFEGKLESRVYQFQVHSEWKPLSVTFNGRAVLELTEADSYPQAISGWYYDPDDRRGIVHIKLPRLSTSEAVELALDLDEAAEIPLSPPYPVPEITPDLDVTEFVVTASSQQGGSPIGNAFDGTPETTWHSKWSPELDELPYTVDIDLGGLYAVNGFEYLSRQIGDNGKIADFEIFVSRSPVAFGEAVHQGTFTKTNALQTVSFPSVWGKHLRLKILSEVNGNSFGSAAEFSVTQDLKAPALPDEVVYLSDLEPDEVKGTYQPDKSIGGQVLTVNGQTYEKGLGARAVSELVYRLDGSWDRLSGHVGMDDEVGDGGSVMFRVYADSKLVFESPAMTGANIKQLMELKIAGVQELRLVLLDQDDGTENDHGDWIDARLVREGSER